MLFLSRFSSFSYLLCFFFLGISHFSFAQNDTILPPPNEGLQQDLIENFAEGAEEDSDFDFNTAFEFPFDKALDLNKASREDLEDFGLLNDIQINQLLAHREKFGDLIAIHELQTISGFDLQTIQLIAPYLTVKGELDDYQLPIGQLLLKGKNEIFMRWQRVLEDQIGYLPVFEDGRSFYLGDQNKYYFRFKHSYENRLSFGITAEKDPGEEFFKGSNKQGFDFYSAHFFMKDYSQRLKALAIGDYSLNMGQGLIRFTGFGGRKSALVTKIRRNKRTLSKYSSVNEASFMRGFGTTVGLTKHLELTAFYSIRKRDGNILLSDTLGINEFFDFSSLQSSGFHRTAAEIADEKKIKNTSVGGVLKYKHRYGHFALNTLYERFDKNLSRTTLPYNQFYFNGDRLLNASLDYSYIFQNIYFFGETAWSDNNRMATTNGLLITLDRWVDLSLLHRVFQKDYQAVEAKPLAETSGARNEIGLFLGLDMRPGKHWKFQTYFDVYRHPWLRFNADAPSGGHDFLAKLTYWQKRKVEAYIQVRTETKQISNNLSSSQIDPLVPFQYLRIRLHLKQKITSSIELRSRVSWGYAKTGDRPRFYGYSAYQDLIYKALGVPLSFSMRYAIFNSESYDIRFYAYENDLLYSFAIPAYYNKGSRFYINLRYKGIPRTTLEFRYARTLWLDQDTFGSGFDLILDNKRSEIKMQIKYQW